VATNEARQHLRIVPQTENDKGCLLRLLDASASLWNELTYERRQNYFGDGDVWDTSEYRGQYNGVIGSATVQQVTRKNSEAWRSFFALKEKGENANPRLTGATRRRDANSVPTSETTSTRFSGASGRVSKFLSGKS